MNENIIYIRVKNINKNIEFYSTLTMAEPRFGEEDGKATATFICEKMFLRLIECENDSSNYDIYIQKPNAFNFREELMNTKLKNEISEFYYSTNKKYGYFIINDTDGNEIKIMDYDMKCMRSFNFPDYDNNGLFEKNASHTFFIASNIGCTRCGTYEELATGWPFNDYTDKIPMGYDTIALCEKLVIISNGEIVYINKTPLSISETKCKERYVVIDSMHKRMTFNGQNTFEDMYTDNLDIAVALAKKLSKENPDKTNEHMQYMVCRMLESANWH